MLDFIKDIIFSRQIRRKIDLRGKKVVVMGIGLHGGGVSMIKWLAKQGARVVATDKKTEKTLQPSLKKLQKLIKSKKVKLIVGRHRFDDFRSADLVIKNPSVPWNNVYIRTAQKNGIKVEMDSSLFFQLSPSRKIIGITGTKGKTTTAYLIEAILKKAGKKVVLVGTGQISVMDRLRLIDKKTYVVFELSSWRLSALRRHRLSPPFAVVTNLYADHLNYYHSLQRYVQDKMAIVRFQKKKDLAVLNYDDDLVRQFAEETKAEVSFYSARDKYSIINDVYVENGFIKYRTENKDEKLCRLSELKLLGQHNVYNVLAATALALRLKIAPRIIRQTIINFKGVPHRLEFVAQKGKRVAYNDSAATTPEATIAGIEALASRPQTKAIYLLAGGASKKLDLTVLAEKIASTPEVRKVVLLKGAASNELALHLKKHGMTTEIIDDLEKAVSVLEEAMAADERKSEEEKINIEGESILLLSPGCASFGLFDNEFDRGNKFKSIIQKRWLSNKSKS